MNTGESCSSHVFALPNESAVYDLLDSFAHHYRPVHTYLSALICVVASGCNACNIVVLTRRRMRTPVNAILTAIAVCDIAVLCSNLVFTTHFNFFALRHCTPRNWSHAWALFLAVHAQVSLVGHSSSLWLSVMMALIRYLTLRTRANMGTQPIGQNHAYVAIGCAIAGVAVFNIPNCLNYEIVSVPLGMACIVTDVGVDPNADIFVPAISSVALWNGCIVFRMAYWISGVVFKMLPCLLLTVLIALLVSILRDVRRRRERLHSTADGLDRLRGLAERQPKKKTMLQDRTTQMLLTIVGVFLATEVPQGLMALLSGLFSSEFRQRVYNNVGDLLDLLALINACSVFVINCCMSAQFRAEFARIFVPARCAKPSATPETVYTELRSFAPPQRLTPTCENHRGSASPRPSAVSCASFDLTKTKDSFDLATPRTDDRSGSLLVLNDHTALAAEAMTTIRIVVADCTDG